MDINDYAQWVFSEVTSMPPHDRVRRDWLLGWSRTLSGIISSNGIFELISIITARWEFLGSLHNGNNTARTNNQEASDYAQRFLAPINANYSNIHNISGSNQFGSEFFQIFRNNILHGGTPQAIQIPGNRVVTWIIGFSDLTKQNHLQIVGETFYVDGDHFYTEFICSLEDFALCLQNNTELVSTLLPVARWRRVLWARFCPHHMQAQINNWNTIGQTLGI